MATTRTITDQLERDAVLGLWCIPGVGVKALKAMEAALGGSFLSIRDAPVEEWIDQVPVTGGPAKWLREVTTLGELAAQVKDRAREAGMALCWRGDPDYPTLLETIEDPPPVLFRMGKVGVDRRRVAMVGSRRPDGGFLTWARRLARDVAAAGVGVVSGAAVGVDKVCHLGALDGRGETWAFLGSALDEVDPAQREVVDAVLAGGGAVWSELPPFKRADRTTFPRRNRLISGCADAVAIMRGAKGSGTQHTLEHAQKQRRPLLAVPGSPWLAETFLPNGLLATREAHLCQAAEDVFRAVGLCVDLVGAVPPPGSHLPDLGLSPKATAVWKALEDRRPRALERILDAAGLDMVEGVIALSELEMAGLLLQHPGRIYERV